MAGIARIGRFAISEILMKPKYAPRTGRKITGASAITEGQPADGSAFPTIILAREGRERYDRVRVRNETSRTELRGEREI